jgi:hypothetical protein
MADFTERSIRRRQEKWLKEWRQLQLDVDHWNRTHPFDEPIVIDFDLTADVTLGREKRMNQILEDRLARLLSNDVHLVSGKGKGANGTIDVCAVQAAHWLAGGDGTSDSPAILKAGRRCRAKRSGAAISTNGGSVHEVCARRVALGRSRLIS